MSFRVQRTYVRRHRLAISIVIVIGVLAVSFAAVWMTRQQHSEPPAVVTNRLLTNADNGRTVSVPVGTSVEAQITGRGSLDASASQNLTLTTQSMTTSPCIGGACTVGTYRIVAAARGRGRVTFISRLCGEALPCALGDRTITVHIDVH
jgi:hypothetical protein